MDDVSNENASEKKYHYDDSKRDKNKENDIHCNLNRDAESLAKRSEKASKDKNYNFLINQSNQANLVGIEETSRTQINALFVMITPYDIEKFNLEGVNIDFNLDENGIMWVDGRSFRPIPIKPGVSIFGIFSSTQ